MSSVQPYFHNASCLFLLPFLLLFCLTGADFFLVRVFCSSESLKRFGLLGRHACACAQVCECVSSKSACVIWRRSVVRLALNSAKAFKPVNVIARSTVLVSSNRRVYFKGEDAESLPTRGKLAIPPMRREGWMSEEGRIRLGKKHGKRNNKIKCVP